LQWAAELYTAAQITRVPFSGALILGVPPAINTSSILDGGGRHLGTRRERGGKNAKWIVSHARPHLDVRPSSKENRTLSSKWFGVKQRGYSKSLSNLPPPSIPASFPPHSQVPPASIEYGVYVPTVPEHRTKKGRYALTLSKGNVIKQKKGEA